MKKTAHEEPALAKGKDTGTPMAGEKLSRREFMAVSAAAGAAILTGALPAAAEDEEDE